jgi:hypothetical protein
MPTTINWKQMDDPANPENRHAGNGGDLVKHTVYLALLRHLLSHEPWRNGMILRECHAGRGAYQINNGDSRFGLLNCLYSDPSSDGLVLLRDAQRRAQSALEVWASEQGSIQWYAGSALINVMALAETEANSHKLELYEWMPETRHVLSSVLAAAQPKAERAYRILAEEEPHQLFDGEAYVEQNIRHWGKQNIVLLDPFAMWRQPRDQHKRDRYGSIIDGLIRHGSQAPSLVLFWTWGQAFLAADGDLDGTAIPVRNGYSDLRARLHIAGFHFVLVKWRWGLQFAMWLVVPAGQLAMLRDDVDFHCQTLSNHLLRHGCRQNLSQPHIEISVDR